MVGMHMYGCIHYLGNMNMQLMDCCLTQCLILMHFHVLSEGQRLYVYKLMICLHVREVGWLLTST